MDLCFTKKQILSLLEQDASADPAAQAPTAGTSDKQAGGQGYPEVGKWESGIERGSANQIGVTKWADVVGSKLKRGHANPLKEQDDWWNKSSYDKGIWDRSTKYGENLSKNWDDWGQWSLTIGSIGAAFFIPGAQGLGIAAGLDLVAAADQYFRQNDSIGAGVSTALAFIPYLGNALKVGKLSEESIVNLINKFGPLKTKQQVFRMIQSLPERSMERYTIEQIINKGPKEISRLIDGLVKNGIRTTREATKVVNNINKIYREGKLTKQGVKDIFSRLGLQRFLFDIGLSGLVIGTGVAHRYYSNKKAKEAVNQGLEPPPDDKEIALLLKKVDKMNKSDLENKITPIFKKYDKYDNENESDLNKLRKIQKAVLNAYISNPKSDLITIAANNDKN